MDSRFIENYCVGREEHFASQVTPEWLVASAAAVDLLIDRHFEDERDEGPYTGPSGIAAALADASRAGLLPAERAAAGIRRYRSLIPARARRPAYLCGGLGDAVAAMKAESSAAGHVGHFLDAHVDDLLDNRVPDEILYGRAGALMASKQAEMITGTPGLSDACARRILDKIIVHGRGGGGGGRGAPALMWEWHETGYLGAAHGVAGILQALLLHWLLLTDGEKAEVKATAEWLLSIEERSCPGHWESSIERVGSGRDKRLVHWCHGATGMVGCMLTAYRELGEDKFLEAALRAGELIWREGVLKKGPGLCHGVAGGGIALLQLYGETADAKWLMRAKCFAVMMMDPHVQRAQRTPDSPASLFEGWAGGLSLLTGISKANRGSWTCLNAFPFMPVNA